jgi:hypothetical protein
MDYVLKLIGFAQQIGVNVASLPKLLAEFGPFLKQAQQADTPREYVTLVVSFFRSVAKYTATKTDDAVLATIDRIGVDNIVDGIVEVLEIWGIIRPGSLDAPIGGYGVMTDEGYREVGQNVADRYGIGIGELVTIGLFAKRLLEFVRELRRLRREQGEAA